MTTDPRQILHEDTIAALQANLDVALTDRAFVGDWQEPWPTIRVDKLEDRSMKIEIPGTKTAVTIAFNRECRTIRVEARNPYLGIDLARLVTETSEGDAARFYCEC
ncbi:hypothetical protein [Gulosibacter chungangensis]|uniref:Uncharacterized protein n=1 Tax=Gulosibacter chungangensis TaxID=979746 RepID=A0A7J5BAV3_9MICO|nr:hypothetical protein [Gulosibacter chungangensis]KAB1643154.1 hypothetical protein F8O05_07910 [Gulosibacter chungangensis]